MKASATPSTGLAIGTIVPRKIIGASAPEIAISEPTERSMPPVAMTSVMPTATMTMVATWVRFTLSVCQERKFGVTAMLNSDQQQEGDQRAVAADASRSDAAARPLLRRAAVVRASSCRRIVLVRHGGHQRGPR